MTQTSVCIWAVFSNISPNISSLIVPPISPSSTGAIWLVDGVCKHRSVPQYHQEVSLLSGWQIPARGQTALWKRWRTMSSSSMHCTLNIYQLIYMISVIMHCLFPLQSSESCKTMQVSAIYISIRFEDTFFLSSILTNMQSSNISKSEYQRFLSRNQLPMHNNAIKPPKNTKQTHTSTTWTIN